MHVFEVKKFQKLDMNCIKDPCGIVCIFITYLSILYADYVIIRWIVLQNSTFWGPINVVFLNTIIFLLTIAHLKAVFCDPGLVHSADVKATHKQKIDDFDEDKEWTTCTRCEMMRPPRAHHCRICKKCIKRMDHHCPWINVCLKI